MNTHVFTGAVYNLSFDLLKDLAPVTLLTSAPMLFVARKDFPPNNLKELVAWMKEHPKGATFGTVGLGSPGKVWATDFQNKIGIEFQFVPYRGAAAIIQDLMAGQIDLACVEASNVVAHLRGGKIKAYAVLDKTRWSAAPDVPTIDEAGAPGFYMTFWHGLWVPNGHAAGRRSPSSTRRRSTRWPIRRCERVWRKPGRTSCRASSRRRRRLARTTRPRSRSGGRSSRRQASRRSELVAHDSWPQLGSLNHLRGSL